MLQLSSIFNLDSMLKHVPTRGITRSVAHVDRDVLTDFFGLPRRSFDKHFEFHLKYYREASTQLITGLYEYLNKEDLPASEIEEIKIKMREGSVPCTEGFVVRLDALITALALPYDSFEGLFARMRLNVFTSIARMRNDLVHTDRKYLNVANACGLAIPTLGTEDRYADEVRHTSKATMFNYIKDGFEKQYTPSRIVDELFRDVFFKFGYRGPREEGFPYLLCSHIHQCFQSCFDGESISFHKLFITLEQAGDTYIVDDNDDAMDEEGYSVKFVDVNWRYVVSHSIDYLIRQAYFAVDIDADCLASPASTPEDGELRMYSGLDGANSELSISDVLLRLSYGSSEKYLFLRNAHRFSGSIAAFKILKLVKMSDLAENLKRDVLCELSLAGWSTGLSDNDVGYYQINKVEDLSGWTEMFQFIYKEGEPSVGVRAGAYARLIALAPSFRDLLMLQRNIHTENAAVALIEGLINDARMSPLMFASAENFGHLMGRYPLACWNALIRGFEGFDAESFNSYLRDGDGLLMIIKLIPADKYDAFVGRFGQGVFKRAFFTKASLLHVFGDRCLSREQRNELFLRVDFRANPAFSTLSGFFKVAKCLSTDNRVVLFERIKGRLGQSLALKPKLLARLLNCMPESRCASILAYVKEQHQPDDCTSQSEKILLALTMLVGAERRRQYRVFVSRTVSSPLQFGRPVLRKLSVDDKKWLIDEHCDAFASGIATLKVLDEVCAVFTSVQQEKVINTIKRGQWPRLIQGRTLRSSTVSRYLGILKSEAKQLEFLSAVSLMALRSMLKNCSSRDLARYLGPHRDILLKSYMVLRVHESDDARPGLFGRSAEMRRCHAKVEQALRALHGETVHTDGYLGRLIDLPRRPAQP